MYNTRVKILVDKIIYCLYIFIDESGNLDFSAKGTKHFVISAISTIYPMDLAQELQNLKYDFLKNNNLDVLLRFLYKHQLFF